MGRFLNLIYLAAGLSTRFGSNKLLALVDGQPLYRYGLEALEDYRRHHPGQCRIIVVTRFPEIIASVRAMGATIVENNQPEAGLSLSIQLGLSACSSPAHTSRFGAVFLVADQPWLKKETLAAFLDRARVTSAGILTLGHAGIPGNPVFFDQTYFPELMSLEGDHGGRVVCIRHPEDSEWFDVPARELVDMDDRISVYNEIDNS